MQVFELLVLFANDLFVLELEQLTLFLEVSDDLTQALLQQVNLGLQQLDLFVLLELLLGILLHGLALLLQFTEDGFVVEAELRVPIVQIGKFLVLK